MLQSWESKVKDGIELICDGSSYPADWKVIFWLTTENLTKSGRQNILKQENPPAWTQEVCPIHSWLGGYLHPVLIGGYPHSVPLEGTQSSPNGRYPHPVLMGWYPILTWLGCSPVRLDVGTPPHYYVVENHNEFYSLSSKSPKYLLILNPPKDV